MTKKAKTKVPKKVAGVRVPDTLRHSDWIAGALSSPLVREAIGAALIAGAGAAAAVIAKNAPSASQVKDAGSAVADTVEDAAATTTDFTKAAVGALAGLATDAARSMLASKSETPKTRKPTKPVSAGNGRRRKLAGDNGARPEDKPEV